MYDYSSSLDYSIAKNLKRVKLWFLIPALILLLCCFLYFFFVVDSQSYIKGYVSIQKELFLYLNNNLSVYPMLQFNLTQFGDVLISFSLLSVFIVYAPKLWEALLTSAILSLVVSATLKKMFSVPRPAAMFDKESFRIIGETLSGNTSLPSGHSIATFIVITTLSFAFMPSKKSKKALWLIFMFTLGLIIAFSRVGVGAHYPFDVIIGSLIGFTVAVIGIRINEKIKWLRWIKNRKYYPVFIVLFLVGALLLVTRILNANLLIFYFSLSALTATFYLIINSYVKKN